MYIHFTSALVEARYVYICIHICIYADSLRGSSVKIGTIQRRLAWPLRKDDTHKSRSVHICIYAESQHFRSPQLIVIHIHQLFTLVYSRLI